MASEDDVRAIALSLPETEERPSYGTPGFRVKDRLFARIREPGVLVVWCADEAEKDFLIRAEPEKFFTIPHYDGHPSVLVRLDAVERDELDGAAHRRVADARAAAPGGVARDRPGARRVAVSRAAAAPVTTSSPTCSVSIRCG